MRNSSPSLQGREFFYGWWIVLVAAIGLFMGYVPVIGFTFSVFFNPLSQEFHWTRSQISLAFSLSLLVLSVALPLGGRLVDRVGARKVILPSSALFGAGLASFYYLSDSLWHFYAVYVFFGIVGSGTLSTPYLNVISRWFNKKRGLALGLTSVGTGLGTFLMPILAYSLIAGLGWRLAYVILGILVVIVTLPIVGFFLREKPEMMGFVPDGQQKTLEGLEQRSKGLPPSGMTCREAWRTSSYWLMSVAFFLASLSLNGCLVHIAPMLTDRGIATEKAALATGVLGGATLVGRIGTGYLLDRFIATRVGVCLFSAAALGLLMLWTEVPMQLTLLAVFLLGFGIGGEGDLMAYLAGRYFGLRAFGEIYSYILTIYTLGAMIGPLLLGAGYDSTGSYEVVLGPFFLATLVAAGLMVRLGPYRFHEAVAGTSAD